MGGTGVGAGILGVRTYPVRREPGGLAELLEELCCSLAVHGGVKMGRWTRRMCDECAEERTVGKKRERRAALVAEVDWGRGPKRWPGQAVGLQNTVVCRQKVFPFRSGGKRGYVQRVHDALLYISRGVTHAVLLATMNTTLRFYSTQSVAAHRHCTAPDAKVAVTETQTLFVAPSLLLPSCRTPS